jgi:hypothetical protein
MYKTLMNLRVLAPRNYFYPLLCCLTFTVRGSFGAQGQHYPAFQFFTRIVVLRFPDGNLDYLLLGAEGQYLSQTGSLHTFTHFPAPWLFFRAVSVFRYYLRVFIG